MAISPIYQSQALLPPNAPQSWDLPYLNLAVQARTSLSPYELLAFVKTIETIMGRMAADRWAPREIDIDILAIDSLKIQSDSLNIPHPELLKRPFAALPFADLSPNWKICALGIQTGESLEEWVSEWRNSSPRDVPFETKRSLDTLVDLIGILNVTDDSFSGDGDLFQPEKLFERMDELVRLGFRTVDLGAESTNPQSLEISPQDEWLRLVRVLPEIRKRYPRITLSIDTRHAQVAEHALSYGADWINDVCGLSDPEMQKVARKSKAKFVVMHSLGAPAKHKNLLSTKRDAVTQIIEWAENKLSDLAAFGISSNRIIVDPGIGFGKSPPQSWSILRNIRKLKGLGVPIMVGHSRKSFLSWVTRLPPSERDFETAVLSIALASLDTEYLRVHSPETTQRALQAWTQIDGVIRCEDLAT